MVKNRNVLYIIFSSVAMFFLINRFSAAIGAFLAIALLFLMDSNRKFVVRMNGLTKLFLIIAFSCVIYITLAQMTSFSPLDSVSYATKELLRCVIYLLIVQLLLNMTVDRKIYLTFWKVILFVVVAVSILQFTKVININAMLQDFYGESVQFIAAENTELSSFRGGSVFVNPNVFACFLVAFLANYLVVSRNAQEKLWSRVFVYFLCIVGIILTGSRTGFILVLIITVCHLIMEARRDAEKTFRFLFVMLLSMIVLVVLAELFGFGVLSSLSDFRMFKIDEGLVNSFSVKQTIFQTLITDMDAWNVIIGYGPFDYSVSPNLLVDFDLGYFIVFFGIFGILLYIGLIGSILKDNRSNKVQGRMFALIIVLFGFTAGAYFNLRIFTTYLFMFLPVLTDRAERKQ